MDQKGKVDCYFPKGSPKWKMDLKVKFFNVKNLNNAFLCIDHELLQGWFQAL
jgi:hypothetical protein